jgi:nucleotide-binding universal stress UspA family protein
MFDNVLVGVDGRAGGRDAIALAARLAGDDGKLTLAHARVGHPRPSHVIAQGMASEDHEASDKLLEREREDADVSAELLSIASPNPGRALHQQAEEQGADLIVVGSSSRGALGRAMLGDDTRAALNGAPCAVAVACLGYAAHPTPLAKIGVGYNGSAESERALTAARMLAAPAGASVLALEVISIPTYAYTGLIPPVSGESIDEMLEEATSRMQQLPDVRGRAVCGLTGEELAAFGEEVDLLVVGSRGYGPVKRLVLGSTSDFLQRHARCSLLVLARAVAQRSPSDGEQHADASRAATA